MNGQSLDPVCETYTRSKRSMRQYVYLSWIDPQFGPTIHDQDGDHSSSGTHSELESPGIKGRQILFLSLCFQGGIGSKVKDTQVNGCQLSLDFYNLLFNIFIG